MRNFLLFFLGFTIVFAFGISHAQLFPKCTLFSTYVCSGGYLYNSNPKEYVTSIAVDYQNASISETTATTTDWIEVRRYCSRIIRWSDGAWSTLTTKESTTRYGTDFTPPPNDFEDNGVFHPATFNAQNPEGCSEIDPCNKTDTDNDGVCDSCDKKPDLEDRDCVVITGTNSTTGAVEYMDVDEGCDGSTDTTYSNRTAGSTLNFDLSPTGGNLYKIPSPTCGGADANGQCGCKYPSGTTGAPTVNMTKSEYVPITGDPTQPNPDKPDIPDPVIIYPPPSQVTPSDPTIANDPTPDTGSSNEEKQTETQQDIENAIRRLTQMVETQSRDLQEKQLTQIERQDAIIALAQTISQLNRYQTLLTETTNDRIKTTNFKLDVVKGAINAASGQISQNVKDLGSKVAGVGTSVDAQGTAIQGKLDGVAGAIDGQGTAIQGKLDGIASALEGQGAATQEGNAKLDAIGDSLDEIKGKIPSNIVAEGTADHPTENTYDPAFENDEDLQEEPLADSISDFIQNGLPLSSYFKGTKVVISGASPTLSVDVFGSSIVVNFSEYEDILRQAGLVLVMIATVIAFMIIANRR